MGARKRKAVGTMKIAAALAALGLALLTGCAPAESALSRVEPIIQEGETPFREGEEASMVRESGPFTADTPIEDVKNDPMFGEAGRLLFPVDEGYSSGDTLGGCGWCGTTTSTLLRQWRSSTPCGSGPAPGRRCSTTSTRKRKRLPTLRRRTPGCFFPRGAG